MSGELSRCPFTNTVVGSPNLCTDQIETSSYDYNVRTWTAALFVGLFAATSIIHLVQGIRSKRWWILPTIFICAITECLGWTGRLWSALSVTWVADNGGYWFSNETAFLMQISTLIFAPAFLAAFYYLALGRIINLLGPQYCRFNVKTYAVIFIIGDAISLTVQAIGGGLASAGETLEEANRGGYVMVGGVFAQMIVMLLYCAVLGEFVFRYSKQRPVKQFRFRKTHPVMAVPAGSVPAHVERQVRILLMAMIASTVLIFARSIYRCIELLQGWRGEIIANQTLFDVLDGIMVFVALLIFNIIHPLYWLPTKDSTEVYPEKSASKEGNTVV